MGRMPDPVRSRVLRLMVILGAALAASGGTATAARAGAWLQEPGTAYVRVMTGYLGTRERFDPDGHRVPFDQAGGGFRNTRYLDLSTWVYLEAGLAPGWTLVATGSWKRLRAEQPSAVFTTYGLGDAGVGVKRALQRHGPAVASVRAVLVTATGYDAGEYPALGSGVTDLELAGSLGRSLGAAWLNGDVEFVFRGGVFRNRVGGAVAGGLPVAPRLDLRGEARFGGPVGRERASTESLRFDPAAVDPSGLEAAGTVSWRVGAGLALEAEVRRALAGRNTLAGTRWGLAVATSPAWSWR